VQTVTAFAIVQGALQAVVTALKDPDTLSGEAILVLSTRVLIVTAGSVGGRYVGASGLRIAQVKGAGVLVVAGQGLPNADPAVAVILVRAWVLVIAGCRRVSVDTSFVGHARVSRTRVSVVTVALLTRAEPLWVAGVTRGAGISIPA